MNFFSSVDFDFDFDSRKVFTGFFLVVRGGVSGGGSTGGVGSQYGFGGRMYIFYSTLIYSVK